MIVHVWRRAVEADCGPVVVATDAEPVRDAVGKAGRRGAADPPRPRQRVGPGVRGRAWRVDPIEKLDTIVNLQGDLPTLDRRRSAPAWRRLPTGDAEIGTIAAEIVRSEERTDPNVVKVVGSPLRANILRALYFTRATVPYGDGPLYHHIGIYAYTPRRACSASSSLPPSPLEHAREARTIARARSRHAHRGRRALTPSPSVSILRADLSARVSSSVPRIRPSSRHDKRANRIAFQGEPGANSHLAARDAYPDMRGACLRRPSRTPSPRLRAARPSSP